MIGCIIQARMGSTRLPGKTLKLINGQTSMLKFQLDQLHFSDKIKKIVIATTILKEDDVIVNFCKKNNLEYYRGSSKDVLDRYYQCAKKFNFSTIVRITPDNPLIDPHIIDQVISLFINSKSDYVGNEHPKTYPLGFAVDVFSFTSLEKSWNEAKLPSEREHVTPYMYKNKNLFKNKNHFYEKKGPFPLKEIIKVIGFTGSLPSNNNFEIHGFESLNKADVNDLTFLKVDKKRFPSISILKKAQKHPSGAVIINGTNEILVDLFLKKKITFNSIMVYLSRILKDRDFYKMASLKPNKLKNIYKVDKWSKVTTMKLIRKT